MSLQTYDTEKIKSDTKVLTDIMYTISTEAYLSVGGERAAASVKKEKIAVEEPAEEDIFGWFKE